LIRLVGAVLLTGGSSALGFGAVRHLRDRVRQLRQLTEGLETVQRELGWRAAPLPEALCRAAEATKGPPSQFFQLCAQGAEHLNGRPFSQVWRQAAEASQLRLEPEDAEVLEQLGGVLGRYDGESQTQALEMAVSRLEEQRAQAAAQRDRLGKVYGALGVAAGLFLLILLI
jgi:stage III sporulation protein AB